MAVGMVAERLERVAGAEVLHDRRIPRSKSTIDHLVVAPAGVFVVTVSRCAGPIDCCDRSGVFRRDLRLYVGGRDRSALVDEVLDRMEVVRRVLDTTYPTVEVHGVLCLPDGEWGMFAKPKRLRGVTAISPTRLVEHVMAPGPFASLVPAVAFHLSEYLPAVR